MSVSLWAMARLLLTVVAAYLAVVMGPVLWRGLTAMFARATGARTTVVSVSSLRAHITVSGAVLLLVVWATAYSVFICKNEH